MAESNELTESLPAANIPQFSTAEYSNVPGTERCRICNSFLGATYFRVNNLIACSQCASEAKNGQPKDSHVAFSRGLLLGIGGAVIGMIVYAAFTIITGWYIGYLALGVGYLVAKAIMKGSSGLGGRRYQITAVLLTYAAISTAAVPIALSYAFKHRPQTHKQAQLPAQQPTNSTAQDNPFPEDVSRKAADANGSTPDDASAAAKSSSQTPGKTVSASSLAGFLFHMLLLGFASPFLELQDPIHGLIGLFILFIGLRIAWRLTASTPVHVDGPYSMAGPA